MAPPKQPSRDRDTHHAPMLQQRSPDFHRSASITARTPDPNAGLLEPSPSTLIGGLVVGCAIGGVALVWMIYYCWKYCRPRPSYYDDAVRIQKEGEMDCACRRRGRCPEESDRLVAMDGVEEPTRPKMARTHLCAYNAGSEGMMI